MSSYDLKLLDCTLRDGGYIIDWMWGYKRACEIIKSLVDANVDIVEVGFLRNVDGYNPDVSVCNRIEELERLLPEAGKSSIFSAMAMRSNYDVNKLSDYNGTGISMIRITAHDYDMKEGMDFAREVKARGYELSINPINIMGYSDKEVLWIIDQVNSIQPYQFSIVDTFGSMKRRDLDRIVSLVDNNLDPKLRLGLHLHENMALSFSLAQNFIDRNIQRPVTVDASLLGMGRIPGNLPIELIAEYLNEYRNKHYDMDCLMDVLQEYIVPIKGESAWGYTPVYFLSAHYNLHRNYAEHLLGKGNLTHKDINHILSRIDKEKATVFDSEYVDKLYQEYLDNRIDDSQDRKKLEALLAGKKILVVVPGAGLITYQSKISDYIEMESPIVISINFVPDNIKVDYTFFGNHKRFVRFGKPGCKIIATSNLPNEGIDFRIDHNSVSGAFAQGCNSLILLLNLLSGIHTDEVILAGADGYNLNQESYFDSSFADESHHDNKFNQAVGKALKSLGIRLRFLTPSAYEAYYG